MTWKFIYTYRKRCKTGPAHNRCWNWSPFTSKHTWMRFFKFWNTFPKMSTLTAWISWRIASLSCSIVRGVFLYTLPFNRLQRKKSAVVRSASLVSNFLTNFWIQHFDGARLSPNSFRKAIWHALNEPLCQYLRTRIPRSSTVYTDNSLGPLARDSPCIKPSRTKKITVYIISVEIKCSSLSRHIVAPTDGSTNVTRLWIRKRWVASFLLYPNYKEKDTFGQVLKLFV